MRKFLAAALLSAAIATPALAQGRYYYAPYSYGSYAPYAPYAYAQAPYAQRWDGVQIHTPYDVYLGTEYLGADPDPNVRMKLTQDAYSNSSM